MPYPGSPFKDCSKALDLLLEQSDVSDMFLVDIFQDVLKWLCTTPKVTSYRVNALKFEVEEIFILITKELLKFAEKRECQVPKLAKHAILTDVIEVHSIDDEFLNLEKNDKEVVVDCQCAAAILRGAHIFAPGIMGMLSGAKVNDKVSIYADISGQCKKGLQKEYVCPEKVFIGNGIVKMIRHELFGENLNPRGIAVEVTDTISGCPNLSNNYLPMGAAVLQNVPSVVCVKVLDPQENEVVLDMCAAPGNKTTHIAALMKNTGTLVAIDKTLNKVKQLETKCNEFGATPQIILADSTKLLCNKVFSEETFDRILLDAPCSALGQRPQLVNKITKQVLYSYVPLQKKLFSNAVHLLKVNGRLVYSTCTITLAKMSKLWLGL